jgi:hypothetical protein|tara:strand:- start:293 stop:556 length:264 start_codon:yes stop_codon:yes gene_type:complete
MIANLIGGFVAVLVGVSLVGPISTEVNTAAVGYNSTGGCSPGYCSALFNSSGWGSTVLLMVPGFFALGVLGIGIAVTYASLRQAGVV